MSNHPLKDFSGKDLLTFLNKGAIILDIRTKKEYCKGHIKGAILVPTSPPPFTEREITVLKDHLWWILSNATNSRSTPIMIYCQKGKRSVIAKQLVMQLGYQNVISLGGVDESPLNEIFENKFIICHHDPTNYS